MKEESMSTAKLFEFNCLVTAVAVALRLGFHIIQWTGILPIVADGLLVITLFAFYGITRYSDKPLESIIQWYLLAKQVAITVIWICWGDLRSIWSPIFLLVILIYMLVVGERHYKKIALIMSSFILLLVFVVQLQGDLLGFNYTQHWVHYTQMTLYISSAVTILLGAVNNRVEDERHRSQQQASILQQARKSAEQRRDLLMYLKDLQSDFFLEQDLKPSFSKLLQQLLEVTNSTYGFMGELDIDSDTAWMNRPHAHVHSLLFGQLPEAKQRMHVGVFFKHVYESGTFIINNNVKESIPVEDQYDLINYLGIPVTYNYKMVGAIFLANRPNGYNESIIEDLSPFISTYGSIIQNIRLKRAQKKYENELRKAKELAEQNNRLKSQFLTNISHELRTPLSLILGPIDLLKQSNFQQLKEEQWRRQLDLIEKNSRKMLSYIEDIVDLSKLNSEVLEVKPSIIALNHFLEHIYAQTKELYQYRELAFILNNTVKDTVGLWIDASKLEKIINNILSNAFKYTKDGTQEQVLLQAELTEKELQISCFDTGAGISEEHFERIFNRFYQVEQPHERIFSGTGVGLALCKELSELLQIEISVKSRVGEGSCFTLHISTTMLREVEVKPSLEQTKRGQTPRKNNKSQLATSNENRLLVVEDNRDMRTFLKQVLQLDYEVLTAKNGREAWEMLKEEPYGFQLIITDLMMPEMDGFTLVQQVQAHPVLNYLPIIVLSAKAQFDERLRNLRIGLDDYLTKPFEVEELQVMVQHLLQIQKTREKRGNN